VEATNTAYRGPAGRDDVRRNGAHRLAYDFFE
jgi:hypothetical protein